MLIWFIESQETDVSEPYSAAAKRPVHVVPAVYRLFLARNVTTAIVPSPASELWGFSHDLWSPFYEFTECTSAHFNPRH